MTFNPLVPLAGDSPSTFPAQNQANMSRLQTLLGADHQFNLTAAANDGFHNLVHLTQQAPAGALASIGRLYVKAVGSLIQLCYMDDAGREYQITPGIIAAVNFNGVPGSPTIRSSINVTSVVKDATGQYTVNFTTPIATSDYVVAVTGMRSGVGEVFGFVRGAATYSTSVTASLIKIGFQSSSGTDRDVLMGNVIVYSAT